MSITLTGAQVIGFVVMVVALAPTLLYVGKILERVTRHERAIAKLFDLNADTIEKLMERMTQIEARLSDQIKQNGFSNCPMLDDHRGGDR